MPTFNPFLNRPAPDRRAIELEQQLIAEQPVSPNQVRPTRDPTAAQGRARNSFSQGGSLVFGRIVDAVAYTRTYKVQCERGLGTLRCCDSASTSLNAVGPRQLNTYNVGTGVWVLYHPQALHHPIICAVPDWAASAVDGISDYIFQGSNCGLQVDTAHNFPFTLANNGIIDFSAGRPADSLHAGEWGAINELGMRLFLDSMQIQVAVDEETGLLLCYADQYTRLSGHNLDLRSSGSCREDRDDESEFSSVEEYTPYLWEALGLFSLGDPAFQALTGADCQQVSPNRTRLEPLDDRQLGMYRERMFHGYLGQGGKRQVLLPVPGDMHTYDSQGDSVVGVSEDNTSLDGCISIRSSQGVYIAKAPLIPAPKRAERPESHSGDRTDDAYKSCGLHGTGPLHKVTSAPVNSNTNPHIIEPAVVLDLLTYVFNWKGLHPFHYHAKDWYLLEESEMVAATSLEVPAFSDLDTTTFLPQATSFTQKVDDRYGLVEYYANMSFFALLPNGGISQADGWGTEQRSTGGTQYFFAPGDIVIGAGRNVVLMAGNDVIIKGHNCVDLSASNGHLRAEAWGNVQIMGGNSACGGVLIESRSSGAAFFTAETAGTDEDIIGGIVLRAKTSAVVIASRQVDISTAMWGNDANNSIIIDAGTEANIVTHSAEFHRHITNCGLDIFGSGTHVNEYWADETILPAQLVVHGDSFFLGILTVINDAVVSGDISATHHRALSTAQNTQITTVHTAINARSISAAVASSVLQITWLQDHTEIESLEFYFRDETQYKTSDFTICEPLWAQIARLGTGGVPNTWSEQTVVGITHSDSAPYPGLTRWKTDDAYGQTGLNLFDPVTMHAVDRGSVYETPVVDTTSWVTLDGHWPITVSS